MRQKNIYTHARVIPSFGLHYSLLCFGCSAQFLLCFGCMTCDLRLPHGQLTPATKAITFYGTSFIADETGAVVAELDDSEDKVRGSGLGSAHTRQNVYL